MGRNEDKQRWRWRKKIRDEFGIEPDIRIKDIDKIKSMYYELLHSRSIYTEPEKKEQTADMSRALIPTPHERHKGTIDDEFYKVTKEEPTDREEIKRESKFDNLLAKVKKGYIPTSLEVSQYSGRQQREILRFIGWNANYNGQSSLIKGKGKHTYVDMNGKEIKRKDSDKKTWEF